MEMHERISITIKESGITQADICRMTGLSSAKVSQVVSGATKDPRLSTIIPIAKALNVSLDYLAYGRSGRITTTPDEERLIDAYRECTKREKVAILNTAETMADDGLAKNNPASIEQPSEVACA